MKKYTLPKKEEILKIIEGKTDIDEKIKEHIINLIEDKFKTSLDLKRFKIISFTIKPNRNTEFIGAKIKLSQKKPITVIKGSTGTGKTTIYDKLNHFFCDYQRERSRIKSLLTEVEIVIIDENQSVGYTIKYHSQFGFDGQKLKILEQKIKDGSLASSSKVITNPEEFLKSNLFLDYNLNETIFIPEIPEYSFTSRYCTNEEDFRTLFRVPVINIIFKNIQDMIKSNEPEIESLRKFIENYNRDLENKNHFIEKLKSIIERNNFLIDNEEEFIKTSKRFEEIDKNLKEIDEDRNKKIRGLKIKLRRLQNELDEIEQYYLKNIDDKYDILFQTEPPYCWKCNSLIHLTEFKKRVENNLCDICGIGFKNYDDEFQALPVTFPEDLRNNREKINNNIIKIKEEIKEYYNFDKDLVEKPFDIDEQIWNKSKFTSNIEEEIKNAKIQNEENETKIQTAKQLVEDNKNKLKEFNIKFNKIETKIESLEKIKQEIIKYEENQFQEFKNEILNLANEIFVEFTTEDFGMLNFDENKNLVITNSFYSDSSKQNIQTKVRKYIDAKNYLSPGILRKIDLAFAFAFFSLNRRLMMRPLDLMILDGLNFLDLNDTEMIYKSLAIDNADYKIIILNTDDPIGIDEKFYEIQSISRNPLMKRLDPMKNVKKQLSIQRFFK